MENDIDLIEAMMQEIPDEYDPCDRVMDAIQELGLDGEPDQFLTDAEADEDAMTSAGMGENESYGCYGGGDE